MYNKVKRIHFELTDKCNAYCPQCVRTGADWLANVELTLDDVKQIIDEPEHLEWISFCGNYGEPIVAKECIDIIEWLAEVSPAEFRMHTNGSARNEDWWWDFCKRLHGVPIIVNFGIDGITQTKHELYRRNTNLQKIFDNAELLIGAGFEVEWDYLVFKHNQDDIETAKKMSDEKGFSKINIISTERFWNKDTLEYDWKGEKYKLERSTHKPNKKQLMRINNPVVNQINCFAQERQEVYIDCRGYITPCCYLGMYLYSSQQNQDGKFHSQQELIGIFRSMNLDRLKGNLNEVVQDPFFSWLRGKHLELQPKRCQAVCGTEINRKLYNE